VGLLLLVGRVGLVVIGWMEDRLSCVWIRTIVGLYEGKCVVDDEKRRSCENGLKRVGIGR